MKNRDFSPAAQKMIYKQFQKGRDVQFLARHFQTSPKIIKECVREMAKESVVPDSWARVRDARV